MWMGDSPRRIHILPSIYPIYPLVNSYWSHGPVEIVDLPIKSMVIFQFAMLNYQKVSEIIINHH